MYIVHISNNAYNANNANNANDGADDMSSDEAKTSECPSEEPAVDRDPAEILKELEDARSLADERLDQLMRCRAELDNVLKRTVREKEELAKYASERLISKLLCVLDSLEQAAKHDEGSKMLYQQLFDILKGEGLAPIEAVGCKFDPYVHEALFQIKSEDMEEDTVAQEIQRGYALYSRIIRFSKVAVAKR
jgi:molecular chaperone GrpE